MHEINLISANKSFGGIQKVFSHLSKELSCLMVTYNCFKIVLLLIAIYPQNFSIYLPESSETEKLPVLYWLSGLTCNESNFVQKAGGQQHLWPLREHFIGIWHQLRGKAKP